MLEHQLSSPRKSTDTDPSEMREQRYRPCKISEKKRGGNKMHGNGRRSHKMPEHRTSLSKVLRHQKLKSRYLWSITRQATICRMMTIS